jgi:hypothetical protein
MFHPALRTPGRGILPALLAVLLGAACPGSGPTLDPIADQTAEVGVELVVQVTATSPGGAALTFTVSSSTLSDLTTRAHPAVITATGASGATLRFTPVASDVGLQVLTVRASDGSRQAEQSFTVNVTAGSAVPVFREPLGSGTTLDLSQATCLTVNVVVQDPDSAQVVISMEEPVENGFQLEQTSGLEATFDWCPTPKQIDGGDRYTLNLAADDGAGHVGRKKYVIVLRKELGNGCPGAAPVVTHTPPGPQTTVLDIPVSATVSDDLGLAAPPVLYYATTAPADPAHPDFGQFVQLATRRVSGDARNGSYAAAIPNPVLAATPGTSATLYYFLEATDNDDATGSCDHRTRAPAGDVYTVTVTRSSGGGSLGACSPCAGDVQCASGRCVALGSSGAWCLDACESPGAACGGGGTCSTQPWLSVDGLSALVCLPPGSTCMAACVDDALEDNDWIDDPGVPALDPGQYPNLKLCGDGSWSVDEDFFGILLDYPSLLTVTVMFSNDLGDIDLTLLDDRGVELGNSYGMGDSEQITACVEPGLYFANVYSYDPTIDSTYTLVITAPVGGCCVDDELEENDGALEAMPVLHGDVVDGVTICPDDEDWYQIDLTAGQRIVVDVIFDQLVPSQDLDVYLVDRDGLTVLTPCCNPGNGQSGTSNEHLEHTVTATGTYYVKVDGYAGAANDYLIGFQVQ